MAVVITPDFSGAKKNEGPAPEKDVKASKKPTSKQKK